MTAPNTAARRSLLEAEGAGRGGRQVDGRPSRSASPVNPGSTKSIHIVDGGACKEGSAASRAAQRPRARVGVVAVFNAAVTFDEPQLFKQARAAAKRRRSRGLLNESAAACDAMPRHDGARFASAVSASSAAALVTSSSAFLEASAQSFDAASAFLSVLAAALTSATFADRATPRVDKRRRPSRPGLAPPRVRRIGR